MAIRRGRHFLMTPGPTNLPEAVLQAMNRNAVDLADPELNALAQRCFKDLQTLFQTTGEVFMYIAIGHGVWEAALANALAPGDGVLVPETGHFAHGWADVARSLGLEVEVLANSWRSAIDPTAVEARLRADGDQRLKAVLLVHTDTAAAITCDVAAVGQAIARAGHPALLMVDAVASLGSAEFAMDAWGVDIALSASQKALGVPPGLGFIALGGAARQRLAPRRVSTYWDWERRRSKAWYRWFCGTTPEHLIFGLGAALDLLKAEGLEEAIARHRRLAEGVRAAVAAWAREGALELNPQDPTTAANAVTTIRVADGFDAREINAVCSQAFNVALGSGLGELEGQAFRIGHMGDVNEAMVLGTLGCVEAALRRCGVPMGKGGIEAAIERFAALD
ncbi:MAG: pyridoxal-phosphate-dependent aminotransferase family protein [Candidatus Competibacterales bacterium]